MLFRLKSRALNIYLNRNCLYSNLYRFFVCFLVQGHGPRRGAWTPKAGYVSKNLYVKMKESGPLGGRAPGTPPLDPPMPIHIFICLGSVTHTQKHIEVQHSLWVTLQWMSTFSARTTSLSEVLFLNNFQWTNWAVLDNPIKVLLCLGSDPESLVLMEIYSESGLVSSSWKMQGSIVCVLYWRLNHYLPGGPVIPV